MIRSLVSIALCACITACGGATKGAERTLPQVKEREAVLPYTVGLWRPLLHTDEGEEHELVRSLHNLIDWEVRDFEDSLEAYGVQRQFFKGGVESYVLPAVAGAENSARGQLWIIPYDERELARMARMKKLVRVVDTADDDSTAPRRSVHIFKDFLALSQGSVTAADIIRIGPHRLRPQEKSGHLEALFYISPALALRNQAVRDAFLERQLSDWGADVKDMRALAEFLPELRKMESLVELALSVRAIEGRVTLVGDRFELSVAIDPVANTPLAKFIRRHEHAGIDSLPYIPRHADVAYFWASKPDLWTLLHDVDVRRQTTSLPWSASERRFLLSNSQVLKSLRGGVSTMALYHGVGQRTAAIMFFQCERPEEFIQRWIDVQKLTIARRWAVMTTGYRGVPAGSSLTRAIPSMLKPDSLDGFSAAALGALVGLTKARRYSVQGRNAWHTDFVTLRSKSMENITYVGLTASTSERGVVVVAGEHSRTELKRWLAEQVDQDTSEQWGLSLAPARKPLFGFIIRTDGWRPHVARLKTLAPFYWLLAPNDGPEEVEPFELESLDLLAFLPTVNLLGWSEGDKLQVSFELGAYLNKPEEQPDPAASQTFREREVSR